MLLRTTLLIVAALLATPAYGQMPMPHPAEVVQCAAIEYFGSADWDKAPLQLRWEEPGKAPLEPLGTISITGGHVNSLAYLLIGDREIFVPLASGEPICVFPVGTIALGRFGPSGTIHMLVETVDPLLFGYPIYMQAVELGTVDPFPKMSASNGMIVNFLLGKACA